MENKQYETIKLIIYIAIATIVLGAGIWVSTSRKEKNKLMEESSSETGMASSILVQGTDDSGNPVGGNTTPPAPRYVDLFEDMHLKMEGIYPDLSSLTIATAKDDILPMYARYEVTSTSDFTPKGAEIVVEVDTSTIEEFLTAENFIPYSTQTIFTINPKEMSSYLVSKDQWTDTVRNDIVSRAAQAVASDPNAQPKEIYVLLPKETLVFSAENTYAGLYGAYVFFSEGNEVHAAFVSPTLTADGKVEDAALTRFPAFSSSGEAYAQTVNERMGANADLYYFMD